MALYTTNMFTIRMTGFEPATSGQGVLRFDHGPSKTVKPWDKQTYLCCKFKLAKGKKKFFDIFLTKLANFSKIT